jgi:2-amino-4-hydroxy-6-hydroxymethyldihydropteridine diphosphokinase
MGSWHTAYISAGANLGDKLANCRKGVQSLTQPIDIRLESQSKVYQTAPVDYTEQDWFINFVVKISTTLDPHALLRRIQHVQAQAGRVEDTIRFGPRLLDLDILLFDSLILNSPDLIIPHPRMHKRRFVLVPMCDIDPSLLHPRLKQTMQSLLSGLDDPSQLIREITCDC